MIKKVLIFLAMGLFIFGTPGYEYELGSPAYWDEGASTAMVYEANRSETVVPVVPIGKITSDTSVFEDYEE